MPTASSAPARLTTSQSAGPASPANEKTVVNRTGSGFHEGDVPTLSSRSATLRPHTSQAHGS